MPKQDMKGEESTQDKQNGRRYMQNIYDKKLISNIFKELIQLNNEQSD